MVGGLATARLRSWCSRWSNPGRATILFAELGAVLPDESSNRRRSRGLADMTAHISATIKNRNAIRGSFTGLLLFHITLPC